MQWKKRKEVEKLSNEFTNSGEVNDVIQPGQR